jgi:two-component system sensor histidine kinase KdpD
LSGWARRLITRGDHANGGRWWGYGLAVVAVGLVSIVVALLEQVWPGGTSLVMLYLIAVLAVASVAGHGPAVVASALAFWVFDFLFIEPRYTFTVSDPNEWLALLLFLLTAIVTSQLAAALRQQARAAEQRARETATLYDLSRALTAVVGLAPTLQAITDRVAAVFGSRSCAVLLPGEGGRLTVAAATGSVAAGDLMGRDVQAALQAVLADGQPRRIGPSGRVRVVGRALLPGRRALYLPLRTEGRTLGVLRVGARLDDTPFTAAEERTLATFAAQAALAISRAQLAEEATHAEIARRSDELKSALLASVSHDLRTPLAAIKTAVTSLLQPGMTWDAIARHELLTAIDEEADRLTQLVANLLDLSRIEAGTLRPDVDWVDLGETVTAVVHRLRPRLADHALALTAPDDLPLARVDPVHLEQALTNLLENAAKYTPPGTPIEMVVLADDGVVDVAVIDHGPGIPPWERVRVFNKFYRLNRDDRRATGTGLGLAIVQGLIEANGGRVWVEETPGGGATFHLTLPQGEVAPAWPISDTGMGREPA